MDALTSAAASGMRSRIESLDMLANNIANSSAPGFKADREFYSVYMSSEAADSPDGTTHTTMPVIERQWTDFAQGLLTPTNNPLDLALNGKGFFMADSSSGHIFTRNGSFRLSSQGQLQTSDGHAVLDTNGNPIALDSSKTTAVSPQGVVSQDGQDVAQINIVNFQDTAGLVKRGANYFAVDLKTISPDPSSAEVLQGQIEMANSQPSESAVRLITVLRQFESLQKAMSIGSEMNRLAVEEVAKATS
ncbi:MAG TPA: flagellar hook basal-body protein [Bryobacteraceae bacterium]|nr:flagellar hook basal-body protein [Bryobacteraceae bacterium]